MSRFDQNRNMEHLEQQIQQLVLAMNQRDEQVANLQLQINQAEEIHAGALAAAQEAANNALQALQAQVNNNDNSSQYKELSRIFGFVPTFSGNSLKVFSFIRAIDKIIPQIQNFDEELIVQAIKSKVEVDILETSPSETWDEIKQSLILHFGDRRDELALIRDLHKLTLTGTVEEFKENIEKMLVLLTNRAKLTEPDANLMTKIDQYRGMALRVFVDALQGQSGTFVRARNPSNLNEALILYNEERNCIEANSTTSLPKTIKSTPQQLPIRQQIPFNQKIPNYQFPTHQQLPFQPHIPFQQQFPFPGQYPYQQQFPYQQQYPFKQFPYPVKFPTQQFPTQQFPTQQFPIQQKKMLPLPKPTPMEIDHSIRSKQINYANRNPDQKNFKIEELRNINTNEVEEETFQPEQVDAYYNDTSEIENSNENFLIVSGENSPT